jgi:hypothetical protein
MCRHRLYALALVLVAQARAGPPLVWLGYYALAAGLPGLAWPDSPA